MPRRRRRNARPPARRLLGERLDPLLERVALVGEGEFGAVRARRLGDAPGDRAVVREPHDQAALSAQETGVRHDGPRVAAPSLRCRGILWHGAIGPASSGQKPRGPAILAASAATDGCHEASRIGEYRVDATVFAGGRRRAANSRGRPGGGRDRPAFASGSGRERFSPGHSGDDPGAAPLRARIDARRGGSRRSGAGHAGARVAIRTSVSRRRYQELALHDPDQSQPQPPALARAPSVGDADRGR